MDLCDEADCKNDGSCLIATKKDQKTAKCECRKQQNQYLFHGYKCDMPGKDACSSNPCQNRGQCDVLDSREVGF